MEVPVVVSAHRTTDDRDELLGNTIRPCAVCKKDVWVMGHMFDTVGREADVVGLECLGQYMGVIIR